MISVLAAMGGRETRYRFFLKSREPTAPISVARLPKYHVQGCGPAQEIGDQAAQKYPGTAAGVKYGRTHRASEIRNWTGPKLMGRKAMVRTT